MSDRAQAVAALAARLGHVFRDAALLEQALTHASVGHGLRKVGDSERLEFLGDRVLGLVVAEALMARFPEEPEGDLSRRLHALVSGAACALTAREWGVGPALRLPPGETRRGARDQEVFLADACEAVIAAVYLDAGFEAARAVVLDGWGERLSQDAAAVPDNPKTRLQEWALARGKPLPRYAVLERTGPDHSPRFAVAVDVEGLDACRGEGGSRKEAEKAAAQAMLDREAAA